MISAIRAGNLPEAQRLLAAPLAQHSRDPRLWALNGLVLARLGNQQQALASYKQALAITPDYLPALEGAAEITYKAHSPEAETLVRGILRARPDDQTAHGMLAALSFEHGKCETAVEEFAHARDAIASNAPALKQYGYCLLKLRRAAEAVPVFEQIERLDPADPKATVSISLSFNLSPASLKP